MREGQASARPREGGRPRPPKTRRVGTRALPVADTKTGATLGGFAYEYDAVGCIVAHSHSLGGATYYPLTDVQGTVWGYVDSSNNIVARWQYDAWGNVVDESVSVPALAKLRYRFQGREWSATTGLINFRMRWYDSETGRWHSKDPIGISGGLNLYAFCGNDAINYDDSIGLIAFSIRLGPSILLENGPKILPPRPMPSPLMRGWRPGRPIPKDFKPPVNPKANWHNPKTGESLHDDMGHPPPEGPHFDYINPKGEHFRWFPDGRIIPKPSRTMPPTAPNNQGSPQKSESGNGDGGSNGRCNVLYA